jgi:hypothetical protein
MPNSLGRWQIESVTSFSSTVSLTESGEPDDKEIEMSHDEKDTIETATKPSNDPKDELTEAELDQVAGGAMYNGPNGPVNPYAPRPKPTTTT